MNKYKILNNKEKFKPIRILKGDMYYGKVSDFTSLLHNSSINLRHFFLLRITEKDKKKIICNVELLDEFRIFKKILKKRVTFCIDDMIKEIEKCKFKKISKTEYAQINKTTQIVPDLPF